MAAFPAAPVNLDKFCLFSHSALCLVFVMERQSYSRNHLLVLKMAPVSVAFQIPSEIKRQYRGCRAGKLRRERRMEKKCRYKPAVPLVIMVM